MHHSKIANHMPQNCKLFLGLMKEAADLNLQRGKRPVICLVHNISFWTLKAHSNLT
jgi:hypothetical protein